MNSTELALIAGLTRGRSAVRATATAPSHGVERRLTTQYTRIRSSATAQKRAEKACHAPDPRTSCWAVTTDTQRGETAVIKS